MIFDLTLTDIVPACSDPTTIHVQWESTIGFWVEELADAGLVKNDIREDIDATATQYEAEKKDRMQRRKVRILTDALMCDLILLLAFDVLARSRRHALANTFRL